jgi:hypothetical protein
LNAEKRSLSTLDNGILYVTGIFALNIACPLLTCGDWHSSALQWERMTLRNSNESVFKEYGIREGVSVPDHEGLYHVADHIRALLDLLELGNFSTAQGMNQDFICNSIYDQEVFRMVDKLREKPNWDQIDNFMRREYLSKWDKHRRSVNEQLEK